MSIHPFIVGGFMTTVNGYALGQYRPLTIRRNGERVKNPAFDDYSQHVLNLKDSSKSWFRPSVNHCRSHLATFLKSRHFSSAEFLIVPSSTRGKVSPGLEAIVQSICRTDDRLSYRQGSLFRHTSIEKLSKGGDRSVSVHLTSMEYRAKNGTPNMKIILDDVMTSGNSISGSITVVEQSADGVSFLPIVFGKTTHD